ncbi:PPP family 3-phenylpropionic acid transporter [Paenibacillus phyllosphaerae]|uniref:PPP family 3-phenylpropionic acid transporter n=1 Tax=Paenibacillus phyllosphaerae TaxID=274593 RepID=A0A7W5ATF5_9BACL|nr:MFS transporter [Paenibacillus phyllosphaerae]MBB3108234.1 PPP family 3-phenylpropionic acid transporter [Paenibacillus phyllosphaerae]
MDSSEPAQEAGKITHTAPASAAPAKQSYAKEINLLRSFSFSVYMTQAVVVSYLPLYFLDQGFSTGQIGVLYSTGPFISIFANLIMGLVSDKYHTLKKLFPILLIGQLLMIALLFPSPAFLSVCFIMIAFYFFQTPMNPLTDSLILLSSQHTGTPYSLVRIFGSLGFALSAYGFGLLLKETGTDTTLILALCTIGITLAFSFTLKDYQGSLRKMEFGGFYQLIRKPQIISFFVIILIVSISHRMYEGFLAVTMRQMGASDSLVGLAWLMSAVSEIPILFLLGKYGHKFKELPLLVIASLMYALRFWLVSVIDSPEWLIPVQAMHSVSFGIYFATALRYITSIIPDEYRSSGQALYAVVWTGVAGVISGTVGGSIYEAFGKDSFFQLAMTLALIAAAGFFIQHVRSNRVLK